MSAAKKINKAGPALELVKAPSQYVNTNSFYELLFDEANDAILLINQDDWKIISANRRMQELSGYVKSELTNSCIDIFFRSPSEKNEKQKIRSQYLTKELFSHSGFYEDIVLQKKDGYLAFATLSVRVLDKEKTGGNSVIFCILHDIGEKKSMERDLLTKHWELKNAFTELERAHIELKSAQEALVQAGKLAALGELAAGVAHELNQPLSGVMGFGQELQTLLKQSNAPYEQQDFANEVLKNATRMKKIIQQLREFTRKSTEDHQNTNILQTLNESRKLLEQQFKSRGIEVKMEIKGEIPSIYCNPFQLEQVFINLYTNARDAIEMNGKGEGHINISVSVFEKDKRFIEVFFSDDGCGMNTETQNRAFDPFYTTKEVGKGTGLGLSVSYGILSKINGSMMIESTPGKGTCFQIKIPIDYRTLNQNEEN